MPVQTAPILRVSFTRFNIQLATLSLTSGAESLFLLQRRLYQESALHLKSLALRTRGRLSTEPIRKNAESTDLITWNAIAITVIQSGRYKGVSGAYEM